MFLPDDFQSWQAEFTQERARLLAALGALTEGGIVENLQHIGATSVRGLPARPCVDIGLAVWPFPLQPGDQAAVEALGYAPVTGYEGAPEQRFLRATGKSQLFFVDSGSELWTDYLLLRDYLRSEAIPRQAFAAGKRQAAGLDPPGYQNAKEILFRQTLEQAHEWWVKHTGFAPIEAVACELKDLPQPWYISSGWALDLFLGRVSRVHHDVDVVIPRSEQLSLHQYMTGRGWKFVTPFEKRLEPWPPHMYLELPRHQAHAHREGKFIDFLITDIQHGIWQYRREPAIIRKMERAGLRTGDGTPFLAPELVLLYKSKNTSGKERGKDQGDFARVYPHLEPERRAWLRWALTATDPDHPWLEQLV